MLTENYLDRSSILNHFEAILGFQEKIAEYVDKRLSLKNEILDESWEEKRKEAFKFVRTLIDKYAFSIDLPRDNLGIMAQAIVTYLLNIQHAFLQVLVKIDMLHHKAFNEIYMDSMTNISAKVHEMVTNLKLMINHRAQNSQDAENALELIIKLERQIDEDNIVICRQISVATNGDSDFICYMMRKIVSDLEHISDFVKECAEIVAEI
ncbi:MAG: hypothetical protein JW779_01410 [Candidatus Thorarchaeota archaeon]|nr:hypothetical protein [Candidatus Thorarchaeota archaeon]